MITWQLVPAASYLISIPIHLAPWYLRPLGKAGFTAMTTRRGIYVFNASTYKTLTEWQQTYHVPGHYYQAGQLKVHVRGPEYLDAEGKDVDVAALINHECIHAIQIAEDPLFAVRFALSFLKQLILKRNWNEAYHAIFYEVEADKMQGDLLYTESRPYRAHDRFIKIK